MHPNGIPYLVFRLADIIGPRDCTNRFWQYLIWLKLCLLHKVPFYLSEMDHEKLVSLCYVKDIATFLVHCLDYYTMCSDSRLLAANGSCYNLAVFESVRVEDVIELMCCEIESDRKVEICYTSSKNVPQILPSVSCGPISAMKASAVLGWRPTSLPSAIKDTVNFYQNIMESRKFCAEKEECMTELLDDLSDVYPEHVFESFRKSLKSLLKL